MVNKDILNQYLDLREEVKEVRNKIEKLEKYIEKIEQEGTVIDSVSGGNGGNQHFKIEGIPLPEYRHKKTLLYSRKTTLEILENELLEKTNEVEELQAESEAFPMRLPDSKVVNLRKSHQWCGHSINFLVLMQILSTEYLLL